MAEDREMPGSVQGHEARIEAAIDRGLPMGMRPSARRAAAHSIMAALRVSGLVDPAEHERLHAEGVRTVEEWTVGQPTALDRRVAELVQLAQARQIEINTWRGQLATAEAELARVHAERDEAQASAHRSQEQFVDVSHRLIEAEARCASIRADTVARIVARLRLEAHGRWDRGSYLGAADLIERECGERDARTHENETPKEENDEGRH